MHVHAHISYMHTLRFIKATDVVKLQTHTLSFLFNQPIFPEISWMDKVTNEDVLKKVNESKNMLNVI